MIPAGLVNALYQWANGDAANTAALVTERDALIAAFLNGGKAAVTINTGSVNGKTFGALVSLSAQEKLAVITNALEQLGEIDVQPSATYADFSGFQR